MGNHPVEPYNSLPEDHEILSSLEGYYSGAILDGLHQAGILDLLYQPRTIEQLVDLTGSDRHILQPLLAFLAIGERILTFDEYEKTYKLKSCKEQKGMTNHLLDQYIGAYGPCLNAIPGLLAGDIRGGDLVNRSRHASAFQNAGGAAQDMLDLILKLKPGCVLDLGCGTAGLLREIVNADPEIHGLGFDMNPKMLERAREENAKSDHGSIDFYQGDALELLSSIPANTRDSIDLIVAQSLANEFFADRTIDDFLGKISLELPNRILILSDYYGCLLREGGYDAQSERRGVVHDVAQVVSGQGIPPKNLEEWNGIYRRNKCQLLKASSIVSGGVHRFIHILKV